MMMNNQSSPTINSALLELRDASGLLQHCISTQQGALHGALQSFDSAGQTLQRAAYQNGVRHGLSEYYNGPLPQMQQQFVKGMAHGPAKLFDAAGNLAAELTYVAGQLQGEARYYAQGRLVRRANYRAGKLDGTVDDFGMDGALLQRTSYQANALHGPSLRYWPNGQVMERIDFERGLMQGAARQFDQAGKALGSPGPTLVKRVEQLLRGAP
jgi:antitoxin component YwqK of YwqJK toxin-antitoxin module